MTFQFTVSKNDEYKIRYRHDYRLYKCLRAPFGYYERKGWYIMRRGIRQGLLRTFTYLFYFWKKFGFPSNLVYVRSGMSTNKCFWFCKLLTQICALAIFFLALTPRGELVYGCSFSDSNSFLRRHARMITDKMHS